MIKKRPVAGSVINAEGWMMSYADMATILLAMFIVLSTLGKDQTGASLNKGLESWRESRRFFGLDGLFPYSKRVVGLNEFKPRYAVVQPDIDGSRVDQTESGEEATLQHLKEELERRFAMEKDKPVLGQASLDFFDPFNAKAPYLNEKHQTSLNQLAPYLQRADYEAMLVVWAPTPSETAMKRTMDKATAVAEEIRASMPPGANPALMSVAQTWSSAENQRPVFSLILSRVKRPLDKN
jgi:Membrane MotB of proton-channel complex MotA/MotB